MADGELKYAKPQGTANPKKGNAATADQVFAIVMNEAQRRGYSWFKPHHALGMIGSFIQETGNFRKDVLDFDVRGDDGTAHGLMQWRNNPDGTGRFRNLMTFAKQRGADPRDLRTQVSFAFEEGSSGSPFKDGGSIRAFSEMAKAQNLEQATIAFIHAERPAGYKSNNPGAAHDAAKRVSHAMKVAGVASRDGMGSGASTYSYESDGSTYQPQGGDSRMGMYPESQSYDSAANNANPFGTTFDDKEDNHSKVATMVNNSRNFADDLFRPKANPFDFKTTMGAY
jgi:hypothetical protein